MIAVIDSGGANITSVLSAFERLDVKTVFTKSAAEIRSADKVILPGVGAAKDAMLKLQESGLVEVIRSLQQPVMGICLGMQLLFGSSEEGDVSTLGILKQKVTRFVPTSDMPVPHMGWNNVSAKSDHPLLHNLGDDPYFYFVHSYYAPIVPETVGSCSYGTEFTAVVAKDNFMGCQFHPERSGVAGQRVLQNFLNLTL